MAGNDMAGEGISRRLQEAIERLQQDVTRVEVWAGALSGFLKPVPSYDADQKHMLPPQNQQGLRDMGQEAPSAPALNRGFWLPPDDA